MGFLPAADHVIARLELSQKEGNLLRVVLEVAVECEDQVAPRLLESGNQRSRLAEIATESDR